jgi:outer membrane protein assembly factor BamB
MSLIRENQPDLRYPRSILRFIQMIPGIIAVIGALSLWLWLNSGSERELQARIPGTDNVIGEEPASQVEGDVFSGKLVVFDGVPADLPGAWPRFRGRNFDAISSENVTLAREWGDGDPRVLWAIDVGEGYAGAAILAGRVYVLDYDAAEQSDALRCLSLADGREIWRYSYPVKVKRNHGMSRTVPAVTDKYVVSLGPMCHVLCVDSTTGEFLWAFDLVKDFNTIVPEWYAGQCPLIDGDRAIIAPGGDALMIAVDCATGDIVWRTPNLNNWNMTHSSIMPMNFKGRHMYVYCASGGVVGVSAEDGSILWETTDWRISIATVPSPLIMGDGLIFLSGGYNSGSMMLRLKEENGSFIPETVFRLEPTVFGSDQQTPILYNGYIYGVRPDKQLVCLDLAGEIVWTSGTAHRFGLGPYMIADGMIYIMDDSGLLTLVDATPDEYKQLAQAQVLTGHDSWGPMAMAGGRLIVRDLTRMVCLDVRSGLRPAVISNRQESLAMRWENESVKKNR